MYYASTKKIFGRRTTLILPFILIIMKTHLQESAKPKKALRDKVDSLLSTFEQNAEISNTVLHDVEHAAIEVEEPAKRRGRPKGSLNKKTKEAEPVVKQRGRPKGSPNKAKVISKPVEISAELTVDAEVENTFEPKRRGRKPKDSLNSLGIIADDVNDDEDVTVTRTREYGLFSMSDDNRNVDYNHVYNLAKSIQEKNLLASFPIVVTSNFLIRDGQHRYEAARLLNKSIYYRIDDNFQANDIARVNTISKKWSLEAYLKSQVAKNSTPYVTLKNFAETHHMNVYAAIGLLSNRTAQPNNELVTKFKNGAFEIKTTEYAYEVVNAQKEFSEYGEFANTKTFLNAISRLLKSSSYNHGKMIKAVSEHPYEFKKCNTTNSYLEMLSGIYNYRLRGDNRVDFRKVEA